MPAPARSALPGDICLLLVPTADQVGRLRRLQARLQARLGGTPDADLHVTVQRFSPPAIPLDVTIDYLVAHLARLPPLPIVADGLLAFHAAFWQQEVVRWTIALTPAWQALQKVIAELLGAIGCQPHYPGDQAPTCNLLAGGERPNIDHLGATDVSDHLFTARQVQITQVLPNRTFALLGQTTLGTPLRSSVRCTAHVSGSTERP